MHSLPTSYPTYTTNHSLPGILVDQCRVIVHDTNVDKPPRRVDDLEQCREIFRPISGAEFWWRGLRGDKEKQLGGQVCIGTGPSIMPTNKRTTTHSHAHTHTLTHTYTQIHTQINTHTHTCTHTHTHTYLIRPCMSFLTHTCCA